MGKLRDPRSSWSVPWVLLEAMLLAGGLVILNVLVAFAQETAFLDAAVSGDWRTAAKPWARQTILVLLHKKLRMEIQSTSGVGIPAPSTFRQAPPYQVWRSAWTTRLPVATCELNCHPMPSAGARRMSFRGITPRTARMAA